MNKALKARETATTPVIHGLGNGAIASDDDALMLEALRIASVHLADNAVSLERVFPGSPMVERLRVFAEQMDSLHARMSE